jgi:NADP-dependent 3-hydroxy acid dehydrogenase YdfG
MSRLFPCPFNAANKLMARCEQSQWGMLGFFLAAVPVSFWLAGSRRKCIATAGKGTKVVVITGCDTGFGLLCAQELHKQGFVVVAACLTAEGCANLAGKVTLAVQCDVTSGTSIANMVKGVETLFAANPSYKLWALVNNAGISIGGNVDWLPMSAVRQVMEVNFFGVVETTKAFIPLLKKCRSSRIINLSSLAGLVGGQMMGPYCGACSYYYWVFSPVNPSMDMM